MSEDLYVYCVGEVSYDARTELPHGVFSTLEKAQASVTLLPGEQWEREEEYDEWSVSRDGVDPVPIIARFKVDV